MSVSPVKFNSAASNPVQSRSGFTPRNEFLQAPFDLVFAFLDNQGRQNVGAVSRGFQAATRLCNHVEERQNLVKFIEEIQKKLNKESHKKQIASLEKTKLSIPYANPYDPGSSKTFSDVKQMILSAKDKIINVLKTLNDKDLRSLTTIPIPSSLNEKDIFLIVDRCKKIDHAMSIQVADQDDALIAIFNDCLNTNDLVHAAMVAKHIQNPILSLVVFHKISLAYLKLKKFKKAIDIACLIQSEDEKSKAFHDILKAYLNANQFEEAIELANLIQSKYEKSKAFHDILKAYLNANQFEEAIELAHQLQDKTLLAFIDNEIKEKSKYYLLNSK